MAAKTSRRRCGVKSRPDLAGEFQFRPVVEADQQRVDSLRPGAISSDHELLLLIELTFTQAPDTLPCVIA